MAQNLIWATGYNAIAIPMAAGITFGTGFLMTPAVGAVFMSLSTIIVAINAQLLRLRSKRPFVRRAKVQNRSLPGNGCLHGSPIC
jgi:P-type Cu2+ transporter